MSKIKSSGAKHVQNPTGTPMWDEFNGITLLFQPDQSRNPGTFGLTVENGKRVMAKISAEKANNVTVCPPGWYESHFMDGGARAAHGLVGLEVVEMRVDQLVAQNASLKAKRAEADNIIAQGAEISSLLAQLTSSAEDAGAVPAPLAEMIAKVKSHVASLASAPLTGKKK